MSKKVSQVDLALDIGSRKHAYAFAFDSRRKCGEVSNAPDALRSFLNERLQQGPVRMLVEATGIYYLDVALLAHKLGVEVMVINPRAAHHFAQAMLQRSKTDRLDAKMLLEFLKRMTFQAWTPPRKALLALRYYGRYLTQLTDDQTKAKNRLHAFTSTQASPKALCTDLKRTIRGLATRIARLRTEAVALINTDQEAKRAYQVLTSMIGVSATSAVAILAELMVLPRDMRSRACVSHAGLDVRLYQSGSSVAKAPRISRHGNKYLRRALFMPAMSAVRHDPHALAFKERLLARGKKKMQVIVAVMRKMLTAAWAMVKNPCEYDGSKLYCPTIRA